jgi:hypothetical protein
MSAEDADELAQEVREGRAKVEERIEEIQHRLTPGQLIDEALRYGQSSGVDLARAATQAIAQNPVPALLIGAGLLWLLLGPKPPATPARTDKD